MFKITVMTKQYPTEKQEKIIQALGTILAGEVKTKNYGKEIYLYKESKKHKDLERFYELVRQQRILDVARKTLRKGIVGNSTIFFINLSGYPPDGCLNTESHRVIVKDRRNIQPQRRKYERRCQGDNGHRLMAIRMSASPEAISKIVFWFKVPILNCF